MVSKEVKVINPAGLHLKPAGLLCNTAIAYNSRITFAYPKGTANAKSVLSVLGACVKCGDVINLVCEGPDEEEALKALTELIEGGLGEEIPADNGQPMNGS